MLSTKRHVNPFMFADLVLTNLVCTYFTPEYNFDIFHKFSKYLKRSYEMLSKVYFPLKYFLKIAYVAEITALPFINRFQFNTEHYLNV